jgi:Peptidase_C39 like family
MKRTVIAAAVAVAAMTAAGSALAAQPYPVNYHTFDLGAGTKSGTTYGATGLTLAPTGTSLTDPPYVDPYANYNGDGVDGSGRYRSGTWTSAVYPMTFAFNELVSSWNADTPAGTYVQSEIRPQIDDGHWAKWYILGRWSSGDSDFHRTSVGGQGDADGFVSIDTFFTKDHAAIAYQLRLTLYSRDSSTPTVTRYSAVASNLTNQKNVFPSKTTMKSDVDLNVPQYSQETHHGQYPQFDNGGEAWCSPTSTAMVVKYWALQGRASQPTAVDYGSMSPQYPDMAVDYTARMVYDYHYNGAGNWPFNTAYAATRGLVADVTQLHTLAEAEPFIKAGIPLVASIAFTSNKLTGAIKSTDGHLVVIGGFTKDGNVIVYDPASPTNDTVRHVYDREQFERAWIPASGGIVYVDRPAGWAMPSLTANNS